MPLLPDLLLPPFRIMTISESYTVGNTSAHPESPSAVTAVLNTCTEVKQYTQRADGVEPSVPSSTAVRHVFDTALPPLTGLLHRPCRYSLLASV